MFGIALDGCGHAKHLVIGESIGGSGLYDAMRTESERTCLVEHHRVQETSFFEAASIAYKQAVPCANRGRDGGHQRDGQTQRMGAGAHEHGHYALDREAPRSTAERSEEHTSELQSLMRISYAVFCLKKHRPTNHIAPSH